MDKKQITISSIRTNFYLFYKQLYTSEIKYRIRRLLRVINEDDNHAATIYGGTSWNYIFNTSGLINSHDETIKNNEQLSLQQISTIKGNYDILCFTNNPITNGSINSTIKNEINEIHELIIKQFTVMTVNQRTKTGPQLPFSILDYFIGPMEFNDNIHFGTLSLCNSIHFDLYFRDPNTINDPLGIRLLGNTYEYDNDNNNTDNDNIYHKLIFYFEYGNPNGNIHFFKKHCIMNINDDDNEDDGDGAGDSDGAGDGDDNKKIYTLSQLGLYLISNMLIKDRIDEKGIDIDKIREGLFFYNKRGGKSMFDYISEQITYMIQMMPTSVASPKTIEDTLMFLFTEVFDEIFINDSKMVNNYQLTQYKIFIRKFNDHKSQVYGSDGKIYNSYNDFFTEFQSKCLDINSSEYPSLRQLIQTLLTSFNISLNNRGIIQISGGDTYRRIDPNLLITADIDCKVYIPNKKDNESFMNHVKIILLSLLPLLNQFYLRLKTQIQIHFGQTIFTLYINSNHQQKIFKLRQILDFIVPLISLDCKLNTSLSTDRWSKKVSGGIQSNILMTPLDIAINTPLTDSNYNYNHMLDDKIIRTSLNLVKQNSHIGNDILLYVLMDDIDNNLIEEYKKSVVGYFFTSEIYFNKIKFGKTPDIPKIGSLISTIQTFKIDDSNTLKYIIIYLTPIPTIYELNKELDKLISVPERREERVTTQKHIKDDYRKELITKYPDVFYSNFEYRNILPIPCADLRLDIEQVYNEERVNIQWLIERIGMVVNEITSYPIHNSIVRTIGIIPRPKNKTVDMIIIQNNIIPNLLKKLYNDIIINDEINIDSTQLTSQLYYFNIQNRHKTKYNIDKYTSLKLKYRDTYNLRGKGWGNKKTHKNKKNINKLHKMKQIHKKTKVCRNKSKKNSRKKGKLTKKNKK
jgi:hypothetical protein